MTVKEAAFHILKTHSKPMSIEDILTAIEKENLYTFKTKGKRGVVLATLKRHSVNSHSCSPAKDKVFREVEPNQFETCKK